MDISAEAELLLHAALAYLALELGSQERGADVTEVLVRIAVRWRCLEQCVRVLVCADADLDLAKGLHGSAIGAG